MARILILEDEEQSREALTSMLQNMSSEVTVDAAADLATARLLLDSTVSFDLFLLDINLCPQDTEDKSGLLFAEEIRAIRQYEFTPLVMITSIAGLEIDAYRKLHCYQYIVKPYVQEEIQELVDKVLFHIQAEQQPSIIVKKEGINYKISCDEIVYCKAISRGVCICMKKEQMEVPYLSIRQLLEKLPKNLFFQCHRMFVVNKNAVRYYDLVNQVIQVEGYDTTIDIGVTYKAEVRRITHGSFS